MANFINYNQAQGVQTPHQSITQPPIIAARPPTVNDAAVPGQFWLYVDKTVVPNVTAGYLNLGSISGAAQWGPINNAIGNVFADITVNPGPTDLTGAVNIFTGPLTVTGNSTLTGTTNINVGAPTSTFINTGASTGAVTIGNATFGTGIGLFSSGIITASAATINITGANANINVNAGGDITNIGTGTSTGAVNIGGATAGKITLQTNSAAANAILLEAVNATGGIFLDSNAGGISGITSGQVSFGSTDAAADAVKLESAVGGIELDSAGTTLITSVGLGTFRSTTNNVLIQGGGATNTSVELTSSTFTGGVTISAGTSGMVISSTNTSNSSIAITANTGAGGVTITGGTGTTTLTSAGTTKVSSSAVGAGVILQTTNVAGTVRAIYNTNTLDTGFTINNGATTGAIFVGTGAPAFAAFGGSLFIRTDGANNNQVLYVNFDGGIGNWAPLII